MDTQYILSAYGRWLVAGLILWNVYFLSQKNFLPLYVDMLLVTMFVLHKLYAAHKLPEFVYKITGYIPYLFVAYGMVLLEEVYAGIVNYMNEAVKQVDLGTRILQFWSFNLIVFSGLIICGVFLHKLRILTKKELTILASLFGIFAEHVWVFVYSNLIIFFVYAPVVILIYYLIFAPAIHFLPEISELRPWGRFKRYTISILLVYLFSIPFVVILSGLRTSVPDAFPPCSMIPCGEKQNAE